MGCCEHGNEPSGSMTGGKYRIYMIYCYLFKKDSAPWTYGRLQIIKPKCLRAVVLFRNDYYLASEDGSKCRSS
jgi:hypothetical protein